LSTSDFFVNAAIERLQCSSAYLALTPAQREESEMALTLDLTTNPSSPAYDPEFDRRMRKLHPTWFA